VEILRLILLYIHLVGFALLLGGAALQYLTGPVRINPAMLWGAVTQLASGLALAAPIRDEAEQPSAAKLGVKLLLAILIVIMVWASRKRAEVNRGHFLAIIGLTLANAAVAVFW
jgi:hypothetical protein